MLVKGKIALLRKPAILGRRWTHVPKNQLPTPQVVLRDGKGKRGRGYVLGRGQSSVFRDDPLHLKVPSSRQVSFEVGTLSEP